MGDKIRHIDQPNTAILLAPNGLILIEQTRPDDIPNRIVLDLIFLPVFIEWLRDCLPAPVPLPDIPPGIIYRQPARGDMDT